MPTPGQAFYATSTRAQPFTRADVLAGRVIRLSPALITLTDGRIGREPPDDLQRDVLRQVSALQDHGVRSWHVDVNLGDYGGFGSRAPDCNDAVFTPDFAAILCHITAARGGFVTIHLLTDRPARHLRAYETIPVGAVCFQLDAIRDAAELADLVAQIGAMGACASPVIETVGTDARGPVAPEQARALIEPVLPQIGMLTLQAAGTGTRSNLPAGAFARDQIAATLARLTPGFTGTIQFQGGITIETASAAAALGADFLVAGTQLFRHPGGLAAPDVVRAMLAAIAGQEGYNQTNPNTPPS